MKKEKKEFNLRRRVFLGLILLLLMFGVYCVGVVRADDYLEGILCASKAVHSGNEHSLDWVNDRQVFRNANGTIWVLFTEPYYTKTYGVWSTDDGETWGAKYQLFTIGSTAGYVTLQYNPNDGYTHLWDGQYYKKSYWLDSGTLDDAAGWQDFGNYMGEYSGSGVITSTGQQIRLIYAGNNNKFEIEKNANTDGTFSAASGFPLLSIYDEFEVLQAKIVIDSNDLCYTLWADGSDFWLRELDGSSLGSEISMVESGMNTYGYFDAVVDNDDVLHIVYLDDSNNFYYFSYDGDTFTEPEQLGTGQATSAPGLSYDATNNEIYLVWFESAMYSQHYSIDQDLWLDEEQLTDTIASWTSNERFSINPMVQGEVIDVVYEIGNSYLYYVGVPAEAIPAAPTGGPDVIWLWLTDRMGLWMGLIGLVMMCLTPLFIVKAFKDGDVQGFAIAALIMGITGFALVVGWLYA